MSESKTVKSTCGLCTGACGVLITLEDGKPVKIKGDPESPPNMGGLCRIGRAALEYMNHPDRLKKPLKRTGKRGEGKWQEISWEEAWHVAADGLNGVKNQWGPEAVVMIHGSAKAFIDTHLVRLANAFGTPNVVCADHVCHVPRMLGAEFTFGFFPGAEFDHPPSCIIAWGVNKEETRFYQNASISKAQKNGAKLIAVDPLKTPHARAADIWLQVRPGSDLALALGMIHVIINEGLYDRDFVDEWTVGFDKLKAHVQDYSPEKVAHITFVPADSIVNAARLYAGNRPGHIEWGNALDQNLNSFQTCRAISILMALTGNLDVPGGEIESHGSGFRFGDPESSGNGMRGRWSHELELRDHIPREKRKSKVAPDLLPDFRYVTPQAVVKAILDEKPYGIRAAFIQASNPLSCWSNIQKAYQAFKKLDFMAVSDMFMTPTAAMADVVFPASSFLEFDGINLPPAGALGKIQRKVGGVGEARSDHEIINGLAKALGIGEHFWEDIDDFWDYVLAPTGLTFEEFKEVGIFTGTSSKAYKKYEQRGFKTKSGKVDLYSKQLEDWGFDPLPTYREAPEYPLNDPSPAKEYPLICTSRKLAQYRHSGGRQIKSLRDSYPHPRIIIHPNVAARLSIQDGDWVYVESKRGRIRQKAMLTEGVDPRVVVADSAWWFPEQGQEKLFGWSDSNYNVLTSDDEPSNPEVGSFNIRGLACKVYKVKKKLRN